MASKETGNLLIHFSRPADPRPIMAGGKLDKSRLAMTFYPAGVSSRTESSPEVRIQHRTQAEIVAGVLRGNDEIERVFSRFFQRFPARPRANSRSLSTDWQEIDQDLPVQRS